MGAGFTVSVDGVGAVAISWTSSTGAIARVIKYEVKEVKQHAMSFLLHPNT